MSSLSFRKSPSLSKVRRGFMAVVDKKVLVCGDPGVGKTR